MSRDLAFWKYDTGVYLDNQKVYEKVCCEGEILKGLSDLPISEIKRRIDEVFGDYDKPDESVYIGEAGDFVVNLNEKSVVFNCSWSLPPEELNQIIDILLEFGCPLYDPQIDVRFDGKEAN